jgi:hypothetical protein
VIGDIGLLIMSLDVITGETVCTRARLMRLRSIDDPPKLFRSSVQKDEIQNAS